MDRTEPRSPKEKKRLLYQRQTALLSTFLQNGAISRAQYEKSLHDLTVKMGYEEDASCIGSTS